jgi:hypothetical protein
LTVARPGFVGARDDIFHHPHERVGCPWIFNSIEVSSRFWAAALVGQRSRRSTRAFVVRSRDACATLPKNILITSDPFAHYEPVVRPSFGPGCVYVKVKNDYGQDRVKRAEASIVIGSRAALHEILAHSEDSKRPNTSYVERLQLLLRRSCSYLHRRTSGPVRNARRLASVVEILRCSYNFIRPHGRLRLGPLERTPAMVAGSFSTVLSWRSVFAWPLPPPTPATVLRRATEPTVRLTSWRVRRWQRRD